VNMSLSSYRHAIKSSKSSRIGMARITFCIYPPKCISH
jgi:hypothetical protein